MEGRAPFGVRSISAPRFVVESGMEESSSLALSLGGLTHSVRPPSVRLSCPPSSSVEGASGKGTLDSDTHTHRSTTARGGAAAPLVSGERQRRRSHARALTAAGEEGGGVRTREGEGGGWLPPKVFFRVSKPMPKRTPPTPRSVGARTQVAALCPLLVHSFSAVFRGGRV